MSPGAVLLRCDWVTWARRVTSIHGTSFEVIVTPAETDPANNDLVSLGRLVRQHRLTAELTQEGLAARAGLHWTYVSDVERGRRNPTYRVLRQIARALDVRPGDLFPE